MVVSDFSRSMTDWDQVPFNCSNSGEGFLILSPGLILAKAPLNTRKFVTSDRNVRTVSKASSIPQVF